MRDFKRISNKKMFEFIDEFLSEQEDFLHGIDGENCSKSRKYLTILNNILNNERNSRNI